MLSKHDFLTAGNTTINNLVLSNIGRLKMTGDEFLVWMNLRMYQEQGIDFPPTPELLQNTGFTSDKLYQLIQSLIEKNLLKIVSAAKSNDLYQDCYDLTPVYDKLLGQTTEPAAAIEAVNTSRTLFQKFEIEFGRPLSPIEQQTIQDWVSKDNYQTELIELALREAVLNQVYSLKYVDRILLNWEKHNIKTAAQLQNQRERFGDY